MVISEQSDPPNSVEEYKFDYYQKVVQPGPKMIKKWRFYRNGKTWLVDRVRGVHETIDDDVMKGDLFYRCRLRIDRVSDIDGLCVAYMSLE